MHEKLPRLTGKELLTLLCNKAGFVAVRQKGSHVLVKKVTLGGVITLPIPIHSRELKTSLLRAIINEAGMTRDEFLALLDEK